MRFLIFLSLLLVGCGSDELQYYCEPECPPEDEIEDALAHIACIWEPHIDFDPHDVWDTYTVIWTEAELWWSKQQRYGMTFHDDRRVYIWMPYPCDTPGLCPGVFDWEMGLVLSEKILPGSGEARKIVFRRDRGLKNELTQECVR